MGFCAFYPPSGGGSSSNASVGPNNTPIPSSSTLVAGENPSGDLQPLQTNASGDLLVEINTETSGLATAANQVLEIDELTDINTSTAATSTNTASISTSVSSINTKTPALGQAAMAASSPVVIASNQSAVPVSASSLPLPTGAATEATLAAVSGKLPAALGQTTMAGSLAVTLASDQTSIPASNAYLEVSGTGNALNATPIASTNVSAYSHCVFQITGSFSATCVVESSNDNSTWTTGALTSLASTTSTPQLSLVAGATYVTPVLGKYFRLRISSYSSGTVSAVALFRTSAQGGLYADNVFASQTGTWNITNVSGTVSLPTGASTETTLSALNTKVTACNTGAVTISAALPAGTNNIGYASLAGQSGSTNANSSAATTALAASLVVKASAGRLFQLTGVNTAASAQYIQVHNTASVPSDSAVPILLAYVPAGGNFSFDFGDIGRYFSTGITVCNSSTAATKTIGSSNCWFNAEYL